MREKINKLIIIFGLSFIAINMIGYIFKISSLVTFLNNPSGFGGSSVSNIPTILSTFITILICVIKHFLKNRKFKFKN